MALDETNEITLDDVRFEYLRTTSAEKAFSLRIPRFDAAPGERIAIVGPSGCGKTTLLELMTGILVPSGGRVLVSGTDVGALTERERRRFRITRIGLVFQSLALIDYLDVLDNILHAYRITAALRLDANVRRRARELASALDLDDKLTRSIGDLSQGERQRVAIARALLSRPRLLLADEATGNLDPKNKQRILDLLFKQLEEDRSTLLAVSHDHELLSRFDRVVDLREICAP